MVSACPPPWITGPCSLKSLKNDCTRSIFVSATPGPYELEKTPEVAEQIIRPTGLLDPKIHVRPIEGQIDDLIGEDEQADGAEMNGCWSPP